MLSKPKAPVSGGSRPAPSISSASRSRMALTYSVRFRRRTDTRPGLGCAAACASSAATSAAVNASAAAGFSGCRAVSGGICPLRSLRTTFSSTGALAPRSPRSTLSSMSPAVCSRSLWQVTQYRSRRVRSSAAGLGAPAGCADAADSPLPVAAAAPATARAAPTARITCPGVDMRMALPATVTPGAGPILAVPCTCAQSRPDQSCAGAVSGIRGYRDRGRKKPCSTGLSRRYSSRQRR